MDKWLQFGFFDPWLHDDSEVVMEKIEILKAWFKPLLW
jgi:hypothetical protein